MEKRKSIPTSVETHVLTQSKRRCCLCSFLEEDNRTKKGQIAHLDRNPANTKEENLVYLCQPHHDDYDSRSSQTKGLTINEVKRARAALYKHFGQAGEETNEAGALLGKVPNDPGGVAVATGTQAIELILPQDFDSFTELEQEKLLRGIGAFLGVSDIKVICMERGSVKLTLELQPEHAERLLRAAKAGDLADLGVTDARLVQERAQPPPSTGAAGHGLDLDHGVKFYFSGSGDASGSQVIPSGKKRGLKKLYVGNLSYDVSSSDLEQMFSQHGTIESVQIIEDRSTGRSKGFGFVEMASDWEAQAAIDALNGQDHGGRTLKVNEARPREPRGGRGGYGGGGGYGQGR